MREFSMCPYDDYRYLKSLGILGVCLQPNFSNMILENSDFYADILLKYPDFFRWCKRKQMTLMSYANNEGLDQTAH